MNYTFRGMLLIMLYAVTGCALLDPSTAMREGASSSLVDYLYPKGEVPAEQSQAVPQLNLPLRVGIAFVPSDYQRHTAISEVTKSNLLNKVKDAFNSHEYIEHIEVIPDTYLRSSKGFEGMQQVARLYGVDVMALVSYDQVSSVDETKASLLYWTIVGAYLIKGTENGVQTFVDTAVFDVPTRKLLFRAPGTDVRTKRSTAVDSGQILRAEKTNSFTLAMEQMTLNLGQELDGFEVRVKSQPELAQVNWERAGAGATNLGLLLLLVLVFVHKKHHQATRVIEVFQ